MSGEPWNKEITLSSDFAWGEMVDNNTFTHESEIKGKMKLIGNEAMRLCEATKESLRTSWCSLALILDQSELRKWSEYYDNVKSYDEAWETISMANAVVYEDWQNRITDVKSYREGEHYAFICNSVDDVVDISRSKSTFKSCGLYTSESAVPYNQPYGFIFSPKLIVAADSQDLGVDNHADSLADILEYRIPTIKCFDEVASEENDDWYNEVVVINSKKPEAIFYFDGQDKLGRDNYEMALMLQSANPGLDIIKL